jgi:hypothetical protein
MCLCLLFYASASVPYVSCSNNMLEPFASKAVVEQVSIETCCCEERHSHIGPWIFRDEACHAQENHQAALAKAVSLRERISGDSAMKTAGVH